MPSHKQAKQISNIKKEVMYISKRLFVLSSLKVKLMEILPSVPSSQTLTRNTTHIQEAQLKHKERMPDI